MGQNVDIHSLLNGGYCLEKIQGEMPAGYAKQIRFHVVDDLNPRWSTGSLFCAVRIPFLVSQDRTTIDGHGSIMDSDKTSTGQFSMMSTSPTFPY